MIDWLVFTRDRPMQLDLLLRSIDRHALQLVNTCSILGRYSDPLFLRGYATMGSYRCMYVPRRGSIFFEPQFEEYVRGWLEAAGTMIGFLCDDDVFFRPAPPAVLLDDLPFSMRLGLNTRYQHPTGGLRQRLPSGSYRRFGFIHWDWRGAEGDYGYPCSLDGHVYAKETILPLLDFAFSSPTQLEAGMASRADRFQPTCYSAPAHSCLVSIPANRVTEGSCNPIMDNGPGIAELNQRLLDGQRIDLHATLKDVNITAAHQEVPYAYT